MLISAGPASHASTTHYTTITTPTELKLISPQCTHFKVIQTISSLWIIIDNPLETIISASIIQSNNLDSLQEEMLGNTCKQGLTDT